MAQHLAKIFGTEEDKVNCPFYLKMGACRHGDRCSRIHNRPILSQTILLQSMVRASSEPRGQRGDPAPRRSGMPHLPHTPSPIAAVPWLSPRPRLALAPQGPHSSLNSRGARD